MKVQSTSKSVYFLMEVIIVILLFALSSMVCIQVHAHAIRMSHETKTTRFAMQEATSILEEIKAGTYPEHCKIKENCIWEMNQDEQTYQFIIQLVDDQQGSLTIKMQDQTLLTLPFTWVPEVSK